jgi:hypothetical protein
MIFLSPSSGATLLAAVGLLVHGRPGTPLGFLFGNAAMLVAFLDVLGLALLLICITGLIAAWHRNLLSGFTSNRHGG